MNQLLGEGVSQQLANIIIKYIVPFITAASVIWALWIGIQFFMAKGSAERANAKKRLVNALSCVLIFVVVLGTLQGVNTKFNPFTPPAPTPRPATVRQLPQSSSPLNQPSWAPPMTTRASIMSAEANAVNQYEQNGFINPIKDPYTGMMVHRNGVLIGESISTMYGWRRVQSPWDDGYALNAATLYSNSKQTMDIFDYEKIINAEVPARFDASKGLSENNYGLEINTLDGEGLVRYVTNYPIHVKAIEPRSTWPAALAGIAVTDHTQGSTAKPTPIPPTATKIVAANPILGLGATVEFRPIDAWTDAAGAPKTPTPTDTMPATVTARALYTTSLPIKDGIPENPANKNNPVATTREDGYFYTFSTSMMSRTREERRDGTLDDNTISLWQNPDFPEGMDWNGLPTPTLVTPSVLNSASPTNIDILAYGGDGRRKMTTARAIADGIVVAAGNTETDSPYDCAWVVIKHTELRAHTKTEMYSYYGGLYASVLMPDELVAVYNSNPDDYSVGSTVPSNLATAASDREAIVPASIPVEAGGASLWAPKPYVNGIGDGAPLFNIPGANFGPGYFKYDNVIFESMVASTAMNRQDEAWQYQGKNNSNIPDPDWALDPDHFGQTPPTPTNRPGETPATNNTWRLLTDDPQITTGYKLTPYVAKGNKYWFPTSVFNEHFRLDYNNANWNSGAPVAFAGGDINTGFYAALGKGTYDVNLIGRKVKQGEFIGYVGGGLLDPGAGQRRGSYLSVGSDLGFKKHLPQPTPTDPDNLGNWFLNGPRDPLTGIGYDPMYTLTVDPKIAARGNTAGSLFNEAAAITSVKNAIQSQMDAFIGKTIPPDSTASPPTTVTTYTPKSLTELQQYVTVKAAVGTAAWAVIDDADAIINGIGALGIPGADTGNAGKFGPHFTNVTAAITAQGLATTAELALPRYLWNTYKIFDRTIGLVDGHFERKALNAAGLALGKGWVDHVAGFNTFTERHLDFRIYEGKAWKTEPEQLAYAGLMATGGLPACKSWGDILRPEDVRMTANGPRSIIEIGPIALTTDMAPPMPREGAPGGGFTVDPMFFYNIESGKRGRPTVWVNGGHAYHTKGDNDVGGILYDDIAKLKLYGHYINTSEAGINKRTALSVGRHLRDHRLNVLYTRNDDFSLTGNSSASNGTPAQGEQVLTGIATQVVGQRADEYNPDFFLTLHRNASVPHTATGWVAFISHERFALGAAADALGAASIARRLTNPLVSGTKIFGGTTGVITSDPVGYPGPIYELRGFGTPKGSNGIATRGSGLAPAVMLEMGFHDVSTDVIAMYQFFDKTNLATAMGILEYFFSPIPATYGLKPPARPDLGTATPVLPKTYSLETAKKNSTYQRNKQINQHGDYDMEDQRFNYYYLVFLPNISNLNRLTFPNLGLGNDPAYNDKYNDAVLGGLNI